MKTELTQQDESAAVRASYRHDSAGRITQPGKFEGEPIFAPYYWDLAMEGFADADNGATFTFKFKSSDQDFTLWPELKQWLGRKRTLKLWEDSQGFVHSYSLSPTRPQTGRNSRARRRMP